nr:HDOD domain-containing protein [Desulfobulbaceae bacterium]
MTDTIKNIDEIVRKIEQIPTLPIVSKKIMELLHNDDTPLSKIAELIEQDLSIATRILKIANSPFYGTLNTVTSITHALTILGLTEVKGILSAISIQNFFPPEQEDSIFSREKFWQHSVICSQIAKFLARHFSIPDDGSLFLSGLIHDMGKVIFDVYFNKEFTQIVDYVATRKVSFSKAEKKILGVTHYQVAATVLQQWRIPNKIINQVFYHHAPWQDKTYPTGSCLIYQANIFTKLAGFPASPFEANLELPHLIGPNAMSYLTKSGFDLGNQTTELLLVQINQLIQEDSHKVMGILGSR